MLTPKEVEQIRDYISTLEDERMKRIAARCLHKGLHIYPETKMSLWVAGCAKDNNDPEVCYHRVSKDPFVYIHKNILPEDFKEL